MLGLLPINEKEADFLLAALDAYRYSDYQRISGDRTDPFVKQRTMKEDLEEKLKALF